MWTHDTEELRRGSVTKVTVAANGAPLTVEDALRSLDQDATFRAFLTRLLVGSSYRAFRWELPPISHATLDRSFEFVLVDDLALERRAAPEAFSEYFTGSNASAPALAVPNLGKTALLVVPRRVGEASDYAHFARFLRRAPPEQVDALWGCVAQTALQRLSSSPLWVSTAGGGIAWLHVRVEATPKYYAYRPYADAVGHRSEARDR
jgi:hypothetical protein